MSDALEKLRRRHQQPKVVERGDELLTQIELSSQNVSEPLPSEEIKFSKGRTIRLLEEVNDQVKQFCFENDLTQETLFEALFETMQEAGEKFQLKVIELGRRKREQRVSFSSEKAAITRYQRIQKRR